MTAIVPGDILFYLSAPAASAGFATAGVVGDSWGGYISTTALSATPLNNLFPDITGSQNAASQVDYACLFVLNNTGSSNTALNTVAWLPTSSDVAGGATLAIAADPTAASVKTSSSQQAVKITAATNAPAGVSGWTTDASSTPTSPSYTNGVVLGSIAPGQCKALWIRRTASNSSPVNNDGGGIEIDFDTMG